MSWTEGGSLSGLGAALASLPSLRRLEAGRLDLTWGRGAPGTEVDVCAPATESVRTMCELLGGLGVGADQLVR